MSNDKRKSLRRRMRLLMKAMERPIKTNCQGGMSGDNPDLMRLIDDKHVDQYVFHFYELQSSLLFERAEQRR